MKSADFLKSLLRDFNFMISVITNTKNSGTTGHNTKHFFFSIRIAPTVVMKYVVKKGDKDKRKNDYH